MCWPPQDKLVCWQLEVTVQAMASKTKPSESDPGSPNAYSILGTAYLINDIFHYPNFLTRAKKKWK